MSSENSTITRERVIEPVETPSGSVGDGPRDGDAGPPSTPARNPLLEEPDAEDVLGQVFGVDPHLHRTYAALCDYRGCTVDELAQTLDRDPSNVGRSLKRLREKGLADRWRDVLTTGGQVYYHTATPPSEVRSMMDDALSERTEHIREHIENFGHSVDTL